jgi:uncharacterized protein (DUF58 family)
LFDEAFLRKLERLAILTRKATAGTQQGERRSPKRGQSVEFADFRPYVAGDDIRRIDWNAYARLERFFIKLFIEEEDLTVHILVDTSRSMAWGQPEKLWYARQAAGALGYVALVGLDRVTVTGIGGQPNGSAARAHFPPHRGKRQAMALFSFLLSLKADPKPALGAAPANGELISRLRAYAGTAPSPGPLMVFSDLMDDGWLDGLRALASRGFEITLVHLLSPDELNPDLNGDFKLLDSETGTEVEITADFDLIERYQKSLADWREQLHLFCSKRGMHYVPVDTSIPFEELLFTWMRKQGVLR